MMNSMRALISDLPAGQRQQAGFRLRQRQNLSDFLIDERRERELGLVQIELVGIEARDVKDIADERHKLVCISRLTVAVLDRSAT